MKQKTIICQRCKKEVEVSNRRRRLCDICQILNFDSYQKEYQKEYRKLKKNTNKIKRSYTRTVLKNKPLIKNNDEYVEYCKNNWDKIKGCVNCLCPECLQPISNDSFLPWEQEGFYEEEYM